MSKDPVERLIKLIGDLQSHVEKLQGVVTLQQTTIELLQDRVAQLQKDSHPSVDIEDIVVRVLARHELI